MKQFTIALFGLLFITAISCTHDKQRPNILFIMSDDHSKGATGAYGESLMATPNIDRLASQGMRFNNCFNVVSLCGPSRATILSGRYSVHNGYMRNGNVFNNNQITFPKLLQQAGYETAVVGKWHLVSEPTGFDYYNVIPYQGQYFHCPMKESGQEWQDGRNGGIVQPGYLTEVITEKAMAWLKKRDNSKPFCLLVHHKAPHGPYHYPERYEKRFADTLLPEPKTFNDPLEGKNFNLVNDACSFSKLSYIRPHHLNEKVPEGLEKGTLKYKKWAYQNIMKGYYRLVASLDENIGRLVDFLDDSDLRNNTIVVYTSDNGWFMGDHGLFNKMWMYDESLHVPLIVRYPDEVEPATVSDDFVSVLDFAATFVDYAGIEKNSQFQGRSIKPILRNESPDDWQSAHFYHYFGQFQVPAHYGIRTNNYKLIHFYEAEKEPKWELYDLKNDPEEMENVADQLKYKDVFTSMKKLLQEKRKQCEVAAL